MKLFFLLSKSIRVLMFFSSFLICGAIAQSQTINSFVPLTGAIGTEVTISGSGFNTTASNNIVFFGGTKATVNAASSTSLLVVVPVGATYQYISITDITTGLTAYSKIPFTPKFNAGEAISGTSFTKSVADDLPGGTKPQFITTGDIDGDGKLDLIVTNNGANTVSIFRNLSTGIGATSFDAKIDSAVGTTPTFVVVKDLNGDSKPDIAVSNYAGGTVTIYRNTSSVGTISLVKETALTALNISKIAVGDIDGDGKPEIIGAHNTKYGQVNCYKNTTNGSGSSITFDAPVTLGTFTGSSQYTRSVDIGDVDGDNLSEIVVFNGSKTAGINSIAIIKNSGTTGTITLALGSIFQATTNAANDNFVKLADFDSDGLLDIGASFGSDTIYIYRNTNTVAGTISYSTTANKLNMPKNPSSGTTSSAVTFSVGDIDGDGKPDIAVADAYGIAPFNNTLSVFVNSSTSGTISFTNRYDYTGTGNQPICVVIGDFDGDGKCDLAASNNAAATISIFGNNISSSNPNGIKNNVTSKYQIYPNPVVNNLNINAPNKQSVNIKIMDLYGRVVINTTLKGTTIDVSSLVSGIYTINVDNQVFKIYKK